LARDVWSRLQFVVRNEGFGPARNLIIHARGGQFKGQLTATRQITTLPPGRERIDWLDVLPRAQGDAVPLRVSVEYEDSAGKGHIQIQTIYIAVAGSAKEDRDDSQVIPIFTAEDDGQKVDFAKVHQIINASFDEGELRTLCFYLNIDYESLPAVGKVGKVEELIKYSVRHQRFHELLEKCRELRPNVVW
jgi:hypothetical protein